MTERQDQDLGVALRKAMAELAPTPSRSQLDRALTAIDGAPQAHADGKWSGWRLLAASVAAASVVVAGLGVGMWIGAFAPPHAGQSPSPSMLSGASASPSSTAPEAPIAAPGTWERIDLPDPAPGVFSGARASDVVAFRGGFVAIGSFEASCVSDIHEPPQDCEAALRALPTTRAGVVWVSDDARAWTLLPTESALQGAALLHAATDGQRIVATGYAGTVADRRARVWVSEDGRSWDIATDGENLPELVVSTAGGFVGARNTDDGPRFLASDDGLVWRTLTEAGEHGTGEIMSMDVGHDGETVAAVGVTYTYSADGSGLVGMSATSWLSRDGQSWERARENEGHEGAWMSSAAQFDDGWVAVGLDQTTLEGGSETAVWTSPDGVSWSRVDSEAVPETPYGSVDEVVWTGDEILATGTVAGETGSVIAFWRSRDGTTWDVVGEPPEASVGSPDGLLAQDGWALAAGVRRTAPDHSVGVVWIASP